LESVFPSSQKVIRVGWVGTGPFSFYGDYLSVLNNSKTYNFLNMRVTHIWGDDYRKNYKGTPEYVDKMVTSWATGRSSPGNLAKSANIRNICKDFHEMAGEVDAAMIMDFDRAYELSEPFLKRGLPIFICSPVAVSVPECVKILDLAQSTGAAVYTGTFTASMPENEQRYDQTRRNYNNIAAFFASTSLGFYTSYANDGLEPIHWLIDPGVKKVALHGWDGSKGYDPTGIPPSHIHLEYEPRGGNPPIQGSLTLGGAKKEMEWYKVYFRDSTKVEGVTAGGGGAWNFGNFLKNVQQVFVTNQSIETRDDILEKLRVVIGAYKSANEGGRTVLLSEVGDYRMPTVRIEKWDAIPK
jgi:hypothetical protein